MDLYIFRPSQRAFEHAIEKGVLNTVRNDPHHAGAWMYMHTERDPSGVYLDAFKNIMSREYIFVENETAPYIDALNCVPGRDSWDT